LQLAANATDPKVKDHYQQIAENYLAVAQAEEVLAERLEKFGSTLTGLQGASDPC
jgi:hypothetical protein